MIETREFFARCKSIHDSVGGRCRMCPLEQWCRDGVFSMSRREMEDLVGGIEKAGKEMPEKEGKFEKRKSSVTLREKQSKGTAKEKESAKGNNTQKRGKGKENTNRGNGENTNRGKTGKYKTKKTA